MTTHKTMCRWCGGEMELRLAWPSSYMVRWRCQECGCASKTFFNKAKALEWAEQPIPFLPEKRYTQDDYISELVWELGADKGHNELIDAITAALAVREEE